MTRHCRANLSSKHWTTKRHNKTAEPKADQYPTSHFSSFNYCGIFSLARDHNRSPRPGSHTFPQSCRWNNSSAGMLKRRKQSQYHVHGSRKRKDLLASVVIIREHNEQNQGKCHLCALIEQKPVEPMVMIRVHNEENQEKCHLYPDTKQKNRTTNGTKGCDQRTQWTKPRKMSSLSW